MRVLLVQTELHWQDPEANFAHFESLLRDAGQAFDLCVLPEMFSTGFTMEPKACPPGTGERSREKLCEWSLTFGAAFCGSTLYPVAGGFANRLFFAADGGVVGHYDKRHLFAMAGEDRVYRAGGVEPVVIERRGWRLLLQVCYDLRFPVTSSNAGDRYDAAVYVASWPSPRRAHWTALLRARAIENQAVVIGVNRIGSDPNGHAYAGDSAAFDGLGEALVALGDRGGARAVELDLDRLRETRRRLPFLRDAESFVL